MRHGVTKTDSSRLKEGWIHIIKEGKSEIGGALCWGSYKTYTIPFQKSSLVLFSSRSLLGTILFPTYSPAKPVPYCSTSLWSTASTGYLLEICWTPAGMEVAIKSWWTSGLVCTPGFQTDWWILVLSSKTFLTRKFFGCCEMDLSTCKNGLISDNWLNDSMRSWRIAMTRSKHFRLNTEYSAGPVIGPPAHTANPVIGPSKGLHQVSAITRELRKAIGGLKWWECDFSDTNMN